MSKPEALQLNANVLIGGWTLKEFLGKGGNAQVWKVERNGQQAAIKILAKYHPIAVQRFRDEVEVLIRCADLVGVMPILEHSVPNEISVKSPAFYLMPIASKILDEAMKVDDPSQIVRWVARIAETLRDLHARGIIHRDIKDANTYILNGIACIGDFGLVNFPDKTDLTGKHEKLGPYWNMAPEVRRGEPATSLSDVYSVGKLLWNLLSGKSESFDGQYSNLSLSISVLSFQPNLSFPELLEDILESTTDLDPTRRPTMAGLATRLQTYLLQSAD